MYKAQFWQLIEASQNKKGNCDKQAAKLGKLLDKLSAEEVLAFDNIFTRLMVDSYRWDLWAVAYILNSGCYDDCFEYFRCWMIAQGQSYFETAMQNPERAGDSAPSKPPVECEAIWYVAGEVYESKTGVPIHEVVDEANYPAKPLGSEWSEDELETLFPALCEKFG